MVLTRNGRETEHGYQAVIPPEHLLHPEDVHVMLVGGRAPVYLFDDVRCILVRVDTDVLGCKGLLLGHCADDAYRKNDREKELSHEFSKEVAGCS